MGTYRAKDDLYHPIGLLFDHSYQNPRSVGDDGHEQNDRGKEGEDPIIIVRAFERGHRLHFVATGEEIGYLGELDAKFFCSLGNLPRCQCGDDRGGDLIACLAIDQDGSSGIHDDIDVSAVEGGLAIGPGGELNEPAGCDPS